MIVLGIESSCDDTCVGIVENGCKLLGEGRRHQFEQHIPFGGVVPEIAAREHLLNIDEVICEGLNIAGLSFKDLDRIAVTYAPGLVSSLLVGVTAGKCLAWALNKPIVGVNHLKAHICALGLCEDRPNLPFICLLASGGHTQLVLVRSFEDMQLLGETLDDSAGEAFDKVARMLGLPYPGGPHLEKLAREGDPDRYILPTPRVGKREFSFSGLKTAVLYMMNKLRDSVDRASLAASFQEVVCRELVSKLVCCASELSCRSVAIVGGVASNGRFREMLHSKLPRGSTLHMPAPQHCTDNGAMVAAAGYWCPDVNGLHFGVHSRLAEPYS